MRSVDRDAMQWGDQEHLLALVVDLLATGNWQRQGKANTPRPKPIPRPGDTPEPGERRGTAMTIEQWEARRARRLRKGG
jgi:hypothetical protein